VLMNRFQIRKKSNEQLAIAFKNLQTTQEQLVQHEKLAFLGSLTAGIAHEIKNPLNFVNNFADVSKELLAEIKETKSVEEQQQLFNDLFANLDKISLHGRKADDIVKNMLLHSHGTSGEKIPTDINALCDDTINIAYENRREKFAGFTCTVEKRFDKSLPPQKIIPQNISRVLLNLLNNAFYAVQKNKEEARIIVTTEIKNRNLLIKVYDNGSGIEEHIKSKVFNPFFTTKPAGEGTGLGLSISYDIMKAHGGEINIDTENGTVFCVVLPVI